MKARFLILSQLLWFALGASTASATTCTENQSAVLTPVQSNSVSEPLAQINGDCSDYESSLTKEAENEYHDAFPSAKRVQATIGGFPLLAHEDEIGPARAVLGSVPPSTWAAAAKSCDTVDCALGKVFQSHEAAIRALALAKKTGYAISVNQKINHGIPQQVWNLQEVRLLDQKIRLLPDKFYHLRTLQSIERMTDRYRNGDNTANTAAYADHANKVIVLFDCWEFDHGGTIIHEITHQYDFSHADPTGKPYSRTSGFSKISEWSAPTLEVQNGLFTQVYHHGKNTGFVRDYAATDPLEDLAESVNYYVTRPNELKAVSPEKYAFVKKNLFNGREYAPQDNSLPDLDKIIATPEIDKSILSACLPSLATVDVYKNSALSPYWNCTRDLNRQVVPLVDHQKYCQTQGAGIDEALEKRAATLLDPYRRIPKDLYSMIRQAPYQDKVQSQCWAKKDFSTECMLHAVAPELDASVAHTWATQLKKNAGIWPLLAKFDDFIPAQDLARGCLADDAKITTGDGLPQITSGGNTGAVMTFWHEGKCQENSLQALRKQGYVFDSDESAKQIILQRSISARNKPSDVFMTLGDAIEECSSKKRKKKDHTNPCTPEALKAAFSEHAALNNLDAGSIPDSFFDDISQRIQVK